MIDVRRQRKLFDEDQYSDARLTLERSPLGADERKLTLALDAALGFCDKAHAFDWPEADIRTRGRKVAGSWESANAAARKLAVHLEQLDPITTVARLGAAFKKTGTRLNVAPCLDAPAALQSKSPRTLHLALPAILRELANQVPGGDKAGGGYAIGPLRIGKSSRKRPGREVILTLVLAHIFDRIGRHQGDDDLVLLQGEPIVSGMAWDAAAAFASAASGRDIEVSAAKKFLREHRGHLFYRAWPKVRAA